jgi:RNA-directed DNA polymerase
LLYLPWVTSSIFFVFVEFTLLSCLFYSLFNPELACKGLRWIKNRYFKVMNQRQWVFATPICKNKSKERWYMSLLKLSDIPIRRHVKIRADANPLDFKWKKYFDERVIRTKMLASSFSREGSLLLVPSLKKLFSEDI